MVNKGWQEQPARHALSARGVQTGSVPRAKPKKSLFSKVFEGMKPLEAQLNNKEDELESNIAKWRLVASECTILHDLEEMYARDGETKELYKATEDRVKLERQITTEVAEFQKTLAKIEAAAKRSNNVSAAQRAASIANRASEFKQTQEV
jgi:hypothetical protein